MIKRRNRPHPRVREPESESEPEKEKRIGSGSEEEDKSLPLAELLELRRLRKQRQGIDASNLFKGDGKKKKKRVAEEEGEEDKGGLKLGVRQEEDAGDDEEDAAAQARRAVRTSNFTQQTNTLDVDKHMMEYIEENIKKMRNAPDLSEDIPADASESEHKSDKWNIEKKLAEEGSVTNSMAMLTAIPEVDLGMDARLKNIEETEKAKRIHAEERKEKKRVYNDEEHLAANRFFRPNLRQKTDAEIMRDAQREAMGLPPIQERQRNYERPQMSTDEAVMERFKKRMRK